VRLVGVGVLRGVDTLLLCRQALLGCARTARQRRPQRALAPKARLSQ
jgi:hypothetical protein